MMNRNFLEKRIATILGVAVFVFALITACSSDDSDGGGTTGGERPIISDFSPKEGEIGSNVTITGTNLANTSKVTINSVEASITSKSATSVVVTVPDGATSGEIVVQTSSGAAARAEGTFTVNLNEPTITDFTPKEGEVGTVVTITGENLEDIATANVNGTAATISAKTATSLTLAIPEGATSGAITLATADGVEAQTAESFTVVVIGAVVITDITPRSAKAGDVITITGVDMETVSAAKIGGVDAGVEVVSDTEIKLTIGDAPIGLSTIEITNTGGVLTTDISVEEFYVIAFLEPDFNEDFTGPANELVFTTGSDAENDPAKSGWSPEVADFDLKPAPIDGNFYMLAGTSDTADSSSYAGQVGTAQVDAGTFSEFYAGANSNLGGYYFNIQMNFKGIPSDYAMDGVLAGLRVRFDVAGIDIDGDMNTTDQLMEYRPSLQDLMDKGFVANADGWYSISIPFDAFLNPGESGATWADYNVEQNVTRYSIAARRDHNGEFSMSIDNISITKGGPVYFSNN